jgi:hypothetical protein
MSKLTINQLIQITESRYIQGLIDLNTAMDIINELNALQTGA